MSDKWAKNNIDEFRANSQSSHILELSGNSGLFKVFRLPASLAVFAVMPRQRDPARGLLKAKNRPMKGGSRSTTSDLFRLIR